MVRGQVLESSKKTTFEAGKGDTDFIERLGLAAWIAREPGSSIPAVEPTSGQLDAKNRHGQWVNVLADFVSGDAQGREE